ncbi:MAG: hypothetical protein DRK00_01050 [Thermoprotei archaeon]|nr:MAG: hypothetical protein DRK00_01050 [Thermoprotei archaeon]HDD33785.1 hypothetical protein [Thermofilaceae archaeon]
MSRGPLKCPECGALFYSKDDLDAHISAWHKPGGPYYLVCPKCGKRFESRRGLEEHLRKHPEEAEEEYTPLLTEYEE